MSRAAHSSSQRPVTRIVGGYRVSCVDLEDSGPAFRDKDSRTLRDRLETSGYVYLQGALDPAQVQRARTAILDHLDDLGVLEPSAESKDLGEIRRPESKDPWHTGFTVDAQSGGVTGDEEQEESSIAAWSGVGNSEAVTGIYQKEVKRVFETIFGDDI